MGMGDNVLATGLARGAAARGKRIAFGNGKQILWDAHSEMVFRGNPNIANPQSHRRATNLEWIPFFKGHRTYNRSAGDRWIWNYDFKPTPGEIYLDEAEWEFAQRAGSEFVVIEPNVPEFKHCAPNKQWPVERYEHVADQLTRAGHDVVQFVYGIGHRLRAARHVETPSYRHGLAVLGRATLYIGAEGGLHHGAAAEKRAMRGGALIAAGTPAVVLFGGFVPPSVTGYAMHSNLTGGADACGMFKRCQHCVDAMNRISVDEVLDAARSQLAKVAA